MYRQSIFGSLLLFLGSTLFCIALLEGASVKIYEYFNKSPFLRFTLQQKLEALEWFAPEPKDLTIEQEAADWMYHDVLHPYLGFVLDPQHYPPPINVHGFTGVEPIIRRSPEKLIIAILGGSVAFHFHNDGGAAILRKKLLHSPLFENKEIIFINFALPGYKQPQQLLALTYFLTLGAEFDMAINLDGFNEIALPYGDNSLSRVSPYFPRYWNLYSRKTLQKETILNLAKAYATQQQRHKLASLLNQSMLRNSAFFLTIWHLLDRHLEDLVKQAQKTISTSLSNNKSESSFQSTGPAYPFENTEQLFSDTVALWKRSSQQINNLAVKNNFAYFHFLQPNQYVLNSKQLTEFELTNCYINGEYAYKDAVHIGYSLLRDTGRILQKEGVAFRDLTQIFHDEKRSTYLDNCCHLNELGNELLADEISAALTSKK